MLKKHLTPCILFFWLLTLILTSCTIPPTIVSTSTAGVTDEIPTEAETPPATVFDGTFATDAYTVTCIGGQYYLNFKEEQKASSEDISGCKISEITFDSLSDMKEKLLHNGLTDSEKLVMQAHFPKDENGILMCDLTKLYEPVWPDKETSYSQVYWSGGASLGFGYTGGSVVLATEEVYNTHLQRYYIDAPNTTNYTITADYEGTYDGHPCRWIELTRTNGKSFRIGCMELTVDGRSVYAVLNFKADGETFSEESSSDGMIDTLGAPFTGNILTEIDGHYMIIGIVEPSSAPTVEWLTSFGITPYVNNSDHVAS